MSHETPGPDGKLERREVEETAVANAYFLPQTLKIDGDVQTQTLHRGIYDAAVFRAQVTLSGKFAPPDFAIVEGATHSKSRNPISLGRWLKDRLVDATINGLVLRSARGRENSAEFWITKGG